MRRDHLRMNALKDNMLLILNSISSLTAVAHCGRHVVPCSCLIAKGANTESESGNAANNIKGEVKEFSSTLNRMSLDPLMP